MDPTERRKRLDRLRPHLEYLRCFKEPRVMNKVTLVVLMKDLKDEGNMLFKEGEYKESGLFYNYALIVAHQLEKTFYHTVETEFLAVVYCNSSLCSLRIENFKEALKDAEAALSLQPGNIKAMFRRALALEGLGQIKEALAQAVKGMNIDTKNNFDELVASLRDKLSKARGQSASGDKLKPASSESSTGAGMKSSKKDTASGAGKKSEQSSSGSKKKKKKGQSQAQQKQQQNQAGAAKKEAQTTNNNGSDVSVDSDSSDDDEFNFAQRMANVQGAAGVAASHKAPPVSPQKAASVMQTAQASRVASKPSSSYSKSMGLDSFETVKGTNSATKSVPSAVYWPMENFSFRLVCRLCFIKEKEGIGGYRLKENHPHNCAHDVLIVRLKKNLSLHWLKIRPRIVQEGKYHTFAYKLCTSFQNSLPCRIGEANCTFAHSPVEVSFWNLDRDEEFSISGFIKEARQLGIFSSDSPAMKAARPVEQKYIPGMHPARPTSSAGIAPRPKNPSPPQQSAPTFPQHVPSDPRHQYHPPTSQTVNRPPVLPSFSVPPPSVPTPAFRQASPPKIQPSTNGPVTPSKLRPGAARQVSPPKSQDVAPTVTNPFPQLECRVVCPQCLCYTGRPWFYMYNHTLQHHCQQSVLAYKISDELNRPCWVHVRERASHRNFKGNYVMCHSVAMANPDLCNFKDLCSFAHNRIEQALWKLEQEQKYDIGEFMLRIKQQTSNKDPRAGEHAMSSTGMYIKDILDKFGGYFRFICRSCYFSDRPMVSGMDKSGRTCLGQQQHPWQMCRIVAHVGDAGFTPIDERKFVHEGAFYLMCNYQQYCQAWFINRCRFAHSQVEKAVWMLERDTKITREELVRQSASLFTAKQTQNAPPPIQQRPSNKAMPQQQTVLSAVQALSKAKQPASNDPPVNVTQFCRTCWGKGQRSEEDKGKDKCTRGHSNFKVNSAFVSLPAVKEIRSLPGALNAGMKLILCEFHPKCKRPVCNHPHTQEELEIWAWMLRNKVRSLKEVSDKCAEAQKQRTRKISQGESVITVAKATPSQAKAVNQIIAPGDLNISRHYCQYCGRSCNSDKQWDEHCMSEIHINNVNSDKEHQWNFRQPPWGQGINLDLCARHAHDKSCQYSFVPDMYNMCQYAHSQEELDEWRERLEWRRMKRTVARDRNMSSYTEALLEEYHSQGDSINVITESLPDVRVTCSADQVLYREEKNDIFTWTFEVHSKKQLEKVALLYNKDRLHFKLLASTGAQHQIAAGDVFLSVDHKGKACYKVNVHFNGGMFGSFSQWIIFDFGSRPVLVKKLSVEIGDQLQHERVKELREELDFDRWTSQNKEIVRLSTGPDSFTEQLLSRYKEPSGAGEVITSDRLADLNQHNYVHKMHGLLELEEIYRQAIIASYNLSCSVTFSQTLQEPEMFLIGGNGDLFIKVNLEENLSQDTLAGKLVLSSVRTALMVRSDTNSNKVYEVQLVGEDNYGYDGRGKEHVYLVISAQTAQAMKVGPGQTVQVELQFQIDRRVFCRMHYALDALQDTEILFPDVVKYKPDMSELTKIKSDVLNSDQMSAVRHIVAQRDGYYPPFVMYGPFGTGKTETLSQSILTLLRERKENCRILVCTQSNSAADLYITKHLHAYFKKGGRNLKILRLNAEERRLNSVPKDVQPYCNTPDGQRFKLPSKNEIESCQLVLTTVENSIWLSRLGLHGAFSHIFVDEAGQALECEILIPLSLATTKTCIVLTGDHHQIAPTVYSPEARRQNFGVSILVRLFNYYDSIAECGINAVSDGCQKSPLNIFLSINYRTKSEILRFISSVFYGGPDNLKAYGNIPAVMGITPLKLFAVQGKESQNSDSTSYLNHAEAQEVVARVTELLDDWPSEWGPRDAKQVAVISTYSDQVKHIRKMLRGDKRRPYLSQVDVGPLYSFQGKEVRALFITTVRTSNLLREPHIIRSLEAGEDIGELGFMSDPKLLNTALTRTQSFVGVVGDPVGLCLIGDCTEIWRTFLKHCSNMRSVEPLSYTYDAIKQMALQIHLGPEGRVIDMISKRGQESFKHLLNSRKAASKYVDPALTNGKKGDNLNEELSSELDAIVEVSDGSGDAIRHSTPTASLSAKLERMSVCSDDPDELSANVATSSEDILFQLARESLGDASREAAIKSEGISITIGKDGYSVLGYGPCSLGGDGIRQEPFKIVTEDENFVAFSVADNDRGVDEIYENFSRDKLWSLLETQPNYYVKCLLTVRSRRLAIATVQDSSTGLGGKEIEVRGCLDRGHALDGDTVVVQVLGHANGVVFGRVKGILDRAQDPSSRLYVCSVDPGHSGMMTPINSSMPHIYTIASTPHAALVRKGYVCVYQLGSKCCIKFSNYVKVDTARPNSLLFIVRYLCWQPGFLLPFGVVVGVIQNDASLTQGIRVLDVEHNMQRALRPQAVQEAVSVFPADSSIPDELLQNRRDLRADLCFSMGDGDSGDVQWAVSVLQMDSVYEIGVHVTDVAAYIDKDSVLDQECELRGASLFPLGGEPRHMLPTGVATDSCSLVPGQDRLALSVVLQVDEEGNHCGQPTVFSSVINNKRHFTYAEVQDVLLSSDETEEDYLKGSIIVLYQCAMLWRGERLGNSQFYSDLEPDKQPLQHAHLMINEVKLQLDSIIANVLLSKFPETTPLLVQPSPQREKLDKWKRENAVYAMHSIPMTKAFLDDKVCRCQTACTCVFSYIRQHRLDNVEFLPMLKESWLTICQAVNEEDIDTAQDFISSPVHMPHVWVAADHLAKIQAQETFSCSDHLLSQQDRHHYNLCLNACTSVTNPVRNFMSLVLQRMVTAYTEGMSSPYNSAEMGDMCASATATDREVSRYHRDAFLLHFNLALQARPVTLNAVVVGVDSNKLRLSLGPGLKGVPEIELDLKLLSPLRISAGQGRGLHIEWQERVYEHAGGDAPAQYSSGVRLDQDRLVCNIPAIPWQRLLMAVREKNEAGLAASVQEISCQIGGEMELRSKSEPEILSDQTRHFVPFSLGISVGQTLSVQLSSKLGRCHLEPCVQLVQLTPCLAICVDYRRNPEQCFTTLNGEAKQPQMTYDNETTYAIDWLLPSLALESAHQAVERGDRLTIHSVCIAWATGDASQLAGEFTLSAEFCQRSCFNPQTGSILASTLLNGSPLYSSDNNFCLDYLCVRYAGLTVPYEPGLPDSVAAVVNNAQPITWVGHCRVVEVIRSAQGFTVKVKLVQSSMKIPHELLGGGAMSAAMCTVEWICKTNDHRVMDITARGLASATSFVKDIITGRQPVNTIDPIPQDNSVLRSTLHPDQEAIISECYRQPFAVVVGGPGTGKSIMAARLAHLLVTRNRTADNFRQVAADAGPYSQLMVCAPSEKSLDVITGYLQVLNTANVRMVRVYSQEIEERDYPTPLSQRPNTSQESASCAVMEDLALHHVIRRRETPEAKELLEHELLVSMYGGQASTGLEASIQKAQLRELRQANVILCTSLTSARPILQAGTNIRQIILDDAGLTPEVEAIVPLVAHKSVNQLVLLGDPMMPSKQMSSQVATHMGLSRSLLQRYADVAKCLTTQFRCGKKLSSFPSTFFYNENLDIPPNLNLPSPAETIQWPSEKCLPFVFCHVPGQELRVEHSAVASTDCNVINDLEIQAVVAIVEALISRHRIEEASILVIAATQSQASRLKDAIPHRVDVCTVLESMGRQCDYVILSTVRSVHPSMLERPASNEWIKEHLGSMADPCMLNLAITRARLALFIVGNKDLLGSCPSWQSLLAVYRYYNCLQADTGRFIQALMEV